MAVYKVPQDVEADDKLIGPFSFRQFIYLVIVVVSIGVGYGLSRLFVPLAIIPLPIVIFFGLLALPLRKDQPMEIYMAAIVSFYLKPRKRLWSPDGIESLVEITAPKTVEVQRTKELSQGEAEQRLSYLADIVDTRGWAVRGVASPETNSAMNTDAFFEAQQAVDVLDDQGGVAQSFDAMISQADAKRRQEIIEHMHQAPAPSAPPDPQPAPSSPYGDPLLAAQPIQQPYADPYTQLTPAPQFADPYTALQPVPPQPDPDVHLDYNPYPTSMHQTVLRPVSEQPVTPPVATAPEPAQPQPEPAPAAQQTTSEAVVSPDIINLASNPDLSIETIAHEAKRIKQKQQGTQELGEEEVIISLH